MTSHQKKVGGMSWHWLKLVGIIFLSLYCWEGECRSRNEWVKARSILYQIMTDRFSTNHETCFTTQCPEGGYCGGTFDGVKRRLPYLRNLGVTAIWISPHVANVACGYHGYWPSDLTKLNSHFGTGSSLSRMVQRAHQLDLWVMADVVLNHMGPAKSLSTLRPFNKPEHYHKKCDVIFGNRDTTKTCWLWGLPDINDDLPWVRQWLIGWLKRQGSLYKFDGYRADAIVYLKDVFLRELADQVAPSFYMLGETFLPSAAAIGGFQKRHGKRLIDGVKNFPLAFAVRAAYAEKQSCIKIAKAWKLTQAHIKDKLGAALFIDSHDMPRFLSRRQDYTAYSNALVFLLAQTHIPILYYGDEIGMTGVWPREPVWRGAKGRAWKQDHPLYTLTRLLTKLRRKGLFDGIQSQKWVTDSLYAFARGPDLLVVTTNVGAGTKAAVRIPRSNLPLAMKKPGTRVCNFLTWADCKTVTSEGLRVNMPGGMPKIYKVIKPSHKVGGNRRRAASEAGGAEVSYPLHLGPIDPESLTPASTPHNSGRKDDDHDDGTSPYLSSSTLRPLPPFPLFATAPAGCLKRNLGKVTKTRPPPGGGSLLSSVTSFSPLLCQEVCQGRDACAYFTFNVRSPVKDDSTPNCLLFTSASRIESSSSALNSTESSPSFSSSAESPLDEGTAGGYADEGSGDQAGEEDAEVELDGDFAPDEADTVPTGSEIRKPRGYRAVKDYLIYGPRSCSMTGDEEMREDPLNLGIAEKASRNDGKEEEAEPEGWDEGEDEESIAWTKATEEVWREVQEAEEAAWESAKK